MIDVLRFRVSCSLFRNNAIIGLSYSLFPGEHRRQLSWNDFWNHLNKSIPYRLSFFEFPSFIGSKLISGSKKNLKFLYT